MIRRFEELVAWQKARELTKAIYEATRRGRFARDFELARQIQRAAVSVMSNIAEGFDRANRNEFSQFLSIAKGSCAEVRSQLYVALDIGHVDANEFQTLRAQGRRDEPRSRRIAGGGRQAENKEVIKPSRVD